ncbi:MAG: thioredoxin family protein [Roseiflexaceae bacterium]
MAKPIVNGIEIDYAEILHVYRIDARDSASRSMAAQLGLRSTPTYVLFDHNAHEIYRTVGQLSRPAIDAVIQDILAHK